MKKILIAAALLASFTFAAGAPVGKTAPVGPKFDTAKVDSLLKTRKALNDSFVTAHKAKVDSLFADLKKHVPDTLKGKVDTAAKAWKVADKAPKTKLDSNKVDSLKKIYTGKRDTLISKIKDTAAASKIKARIAELEADRTALKAKLDSRKAEIDAKIADLKKKGPVKK